MLFLWRELPLSPDRRPNTDDEDAGQWIARTVRPALAYAITLVRNRHDAEDIVQECYRKLLARSTRYDLPADGAKLLYRSITNACINHVQRRPPECSVGDMQGMPSSPHSDDHQLPEQRLMHAELEQAVSEGLAALPVRQRAVVELSSLGHSLADVAVMAGVSHANARVLLHRARQSLAEKVKTFREGQTR